MDNQQETLQEGSSETVCEKTFNNYEKVKPDHKKLLDKKFLTWLIGFIEGDGSFKKLSHKYLSK